MKVCIIGNGLVSLALANILIKKELIVDILSDNKNYRYDETRTLGISKSNVDYFNKEILNIEKILWHINKIKVYTEKSKNKEILKFDDNIKQIFSIVKNRDLEKLLVSKLKKSKFVKFKKNNHHQDIFNQNYKLIINCDQNNLITKKFFSKKIVKNYNSYAYTTTINHKKINNKTAFQNFTNDGPIAFLPISEIQTSVVYSLRTKNKKNNFNIESLIRKYNPIYSITKINDCNRFQLKSSSSRKYYKDNILAFGDVLHKIHPLAGQGFNMSLRDIKLLSNLIDEKINLGLDLDSTLCQDFQKNSQDKNYLFSTGIDCVYELFNFESRFNSNFLGNSINLIGKNKIVNSIFKKIANDGIRF